MKKLTLEVKVYLLLCILGYIIGLLLLFNTPLSVEWCGGISVTFVVFSVWILLRIEEKYFNNKHLNIQECINPMPEKDIDLFVIKLLACSLAAALIMVKLTYKNSFLLCGIIGIQTVTFDGFITTAQREGASDPYSWVFPVFAPLVIYLILCTKNLLRPDNVWSNDIIRGKGVKSNEYQSEITAIRNTLLKATKVYMFIYASINVIGVLYIIYIGYIM